MHALVVEGVVRGAEEFLERLAVVERGVVLPGMKRTVFTSSCAAISLNSASRLRRSMGLSVVWVRSPVKTMKSGGSPSALTAATALGSVPRASGLTAGPLKPQCVSDSCTK
jgi:hypothetical protein